MLVEELFIILLDISDLYGVRDLNYNLCVFQFDQTLRHFRAPARAPATEPGSGAENPRDPPLIGHECLSRGPPWLSKPVPEQHQ